MKDDMRIDRKNRRRQRQQKRLIIMTGMTLILVLILGFAIFGVVKFIQGNSPKEKTVAEENAEIQEEAIPESVVIEEKEPEIKEDMDIDDPQFSGDDSNTDEENGENPDAEKQNESEKDVSSEQKQDTAKDIATVENILQSNAAAETGDVTYGIDVAKYQGTIDWAKVAASGVQYAMVRVGYRTQQEGKILPDTNAKYNMQEAQANGIKLGAYFFSTAISEAEAIEEADFVADMISQYQITYPVAYNCEGFGSTSSRQYSLTQTQRTTIAKAFLNEIYARGYTPMFYAAKGELTGSACWDTEALESTYKMWIAYYPGADYDYSKGPGYGGKFHMWQYTSTGQIDGIKKNVDINIANFGYSGNAAAKNETAPEVAKADAEALMKFTEVNEIVTAKSKTNLRDIPSQGEDSKVLVTLTNPDTATRTGISDSGWSRVVYNGQTCYAVSSFLTTDTGAPPQTTQPAQEAQTQEGGIKTKFTACDDIITAKKEVNLRSLPSVTNEQAQVVYTLKNGENVHRTGYNQEYGWSRVEINGQVLYCITSYITVVQ